MFPVGPFLGLEKQLHAVINLEMKCGGANIAVLGMPLPESSKIFPGGTADDSRVISEFGGLGLANQPTALAKTTLLVRRVGYVSCFKNIQLFFFHRC